MISPMLINLNTVLKGYIPLQGHQSSSSAIHVQPEPGSALIACPRCDGTRIHHFMQLARLLVRDFKNHRDNLAALRKATERLNGLQRSRLDELFAAHPILQTLHEAMHRLRDLMNHKHQSKKQCKEHIQRRAYGFRNFANYRLRVIVQCG